jgi:hypothetical protein
MSTQVLANFPLVVTGVRNCVNLVSFGLSGLRESSH